MSDQSIFRVNLYSLICLFLILAAPSVFAQTTDIQFENISSGDNFTFPDAITPITTVTDLIDPNPAIEYELNGERLIAPPTVTDPGNYRYGVIVQNLLGNVTRKEVLFSILPYPLLTGVVSPETLDIVEDSDGKITVRASILLGSRNFDPRELNLRTVGMFLFDEDGRPINSAPIRLAQRQKLQNKFLPCIEVMEPETEKLLQVGYGLNRSLKDASGSLQVEAGTCKCKALNDEIPTLEEVLYERGYVVLPFNSTFTKRNGTKSVRTIEIVGRAFNRQTKDPMYDISGTGIAEVSQDPSAIFESLEIVNDSVTSIIPEETIPKCAWKSSLTRGAKDVETEKSSSNSGCLSNFKSYSADLVADGPSLTCTTDLSVPWDCYSGWSRSNAVGSNFDFRVWLDGDCEKPRIEFSLKPSVKMRSEVAAGGIHLVDIKAEMAGMTQVSAEGQTATAAGAVGAGHNVSSEITLSASPEIKVSVVATQNPMEKVFSDSKAGSINASSITVAGVTAVYAYSEAAPPAWGTNSAKNNLLSATPGISVTGSCNDKCGCKASGTFRLN